jgi:hypothetical protein
MPYAGIDEGGEFSSGFLGVLGTWIESSKEFAWNNPVGTRKRDGWSDNGDRSI